MLELHAVPSPLGAHIPCLPATAHELQAGHAATPQQKPSVQWPLIHSPSAPQAEPFAFRFVHEYPRQTNPATQSAAVAHVVLQALAPQRYGEQLIDGWLHAPAPSQPPTGVTVEPLHEAVPQPVPAAM
jgi:hypothetical protein